MKDFGKKEATIYVKQDEHANMHSLPFRYGFYFKANQKLEICECKDWLNETSKEGQKTIKVTANFRDDKGKTWNALFTLIDNKAQYYKLVTLWDPADRATQEEEFSIELRTRDRERKLIKKIDKTIDLLETDDFGYCETCGIEIGLRRLEARPTATQCVDCKALDEIKEKQMHG